MPTYSELLRAMPERGRDCGLGDILNNEGQAKHDEVLETIFEIDPSTGRPFSVAKLESLFKGEYGWSTWFFRRHREGKCVSCLRRT